MLALLASGLLALSPPTLPEEPGGAAVDEATPTAVEGPAEAPAPEEEAFVVEAPAELPVAEEVAPVVVAPPAGSTTTIAGGSTTVVVVDEQNKLPALPAPPMHVVPAPPWSGAGRFVGGSVMLIAGVGLLTAATFEFADGRDTTQPLIGQVPAGLTMLVAGGVMIGTGVRDQHRLGEWETATGIKPHPTGNGLIVGGVTAISLGSMAAIATSIAVDMDLDAPRSIPAGWATAGAALGTGTALLIAGIVRRARYGKWRRRVTGTPMVSPMRSGASLGFHTRF